ncbi:MAG TPA: VWA domain-containing protein [Nocardioides sp.]
MTSPGTASHSAEEILLGFARALRAAGLGVTQDRAREFAAAAALVGIDDPRATYWAGQATLCSGPDDLERYDQVFHAWFTDRGSLPSPAPTTAVRPFDTGLMQDDDGGAGEEGDPVRAAASATEVLRHRDLATLTASERALLAALFGALHPRLPQRRTPRQRPWHRGRVDAGRTMRNSLRRMGEPADLAWRRRGRRHRRVVLLVDVSGSMSGYADPLLRLAHRFVIAAAAAGARREVEVFTIGTRLTHLTAALAQRDPERALLAAGRAVPDWSGGTRLGEVLQVFLDRWGARGLVRGAVAVVFSDGWERGDAALLAEQMARLHRLAHRVVWVNPHRGKEGYLPVQQGVVAALPHIDEFLAGHSLATYAELVEVIADA